MTKEIDTEKIQEIIFLSWLWVCEYILNIVFEAGYVTYTLFHVMKINRFPGV